MLDMGIEAVRGEVKTRADFDIDNVAPIEKAPKARCPVFFGCGVDDDLVLPHHSQDLYNAWGGEDRAIRTFEGGHNERRPAWFMHEAADWLVMKLDPKDLPYEAVPLQLQSAMQETPAALQARDPLSGPPSRRMSDQGIGFYPSQDGLATPAGLHSGYATPSGMRTGYATPAGARSGYSTPGGGNRSQFYIGANGPEAI